jgi:hypothetical protein
MRKCFAILAMLAALWISIPAQAQGALHLTSVSVDVWPEYDQPAVLVIYHLSLDPATKLPATVNLRIPATAEVYAVAVSDPTSGLVNAPYNRTVQGQWATLAITANSTGVQVEYYDTLSKTGTSRHIVFEWAGDYGVDAFSVNLQEPAGATDLITDPALTQSTTGQDGLTYLQSAPQALSAGQSYTLTVDYQKTTDTLSTTGLPVQPTEPLTTSTPGRETTSSIVWVLAGIGGTLVVVSIVMGFFMWRSGTRRPATSRKRHAPSRSAREDDAIYCNQCGKRAQPEDEFCRTCGTRLPRK